MPGPKQAPHPALDDAAQLTSWPAPPRVAVRDVCSVPGFGSCVGSAPFRSFFRPSVYSPRFRVGLRLAAAPLPVDSTHLPTFAFPVRRSVFSRRSVAGPRAGGKHGSRGVGPQSNAAKNARVTYSPANTAMERRKITYAAGRLRDGEHGGTRLWTTGRQTAVTSERRE
jgi:hypothetical protein